MDDADRRDVPRPPSSSTASRPRAPWMLVGVVVGVTGLATSYAAAALMRERLTPVTAVAELVIRVTPGGLAEAAIQAVGHRDKPILVGTIVVLLIGLFALIGALAQRRTWAPVAGFGTLAAVGVAATLTASGTVATDLIPTAVGLATWLFASSVLTGQLRAMEAAAPGDADGDVAPFAVWERSRRGFLIGVGAVVGLAAFGAAVGKVAGGARQKVEQARRLLRLDLTEPSVPADVGVAADGVLPWMTPVDQFYLIDTAVIRPTILPADWTLRIHGMVERELTLTYDDLVARELTETWVTLNCVSNPVGGELIGNAWWSGVRLDAILAEAGPLPGADAVVQTSQDGWTCGTPLAALTDGRDAMLALAMNGQPLTIEHGFPVRTLVPGLYGYVSACKWVVDMEVTQYGTFQAFWTERGWGEMGPVKMSSRVDVPRAGTSVETDDAGQVVVAGSAWSQHTGISAVEVAVDGGAWQPAELAAEPTVDSWVQWRAVVSLDAGEHTVKVRATDRDGQVQTGVERDVLPDGATGWDSVRFEVA